jgi:hypothetical protein
MSEWPNYYPQGCPPGDAPLAQGKVYRFVSATPSISDFDPHYLRRPDKAWDGVLCQACGLSVNVTFEHARSKRALLAPLRKKKIAVAELTAKDGRLAPTPALSDHHHHTWWRSMTSADPLELFKLVEEAIAG